MNEVMQNILLLSAAGSVLALVLLCIKPLTKRLFSPKWQYYIWLTVLIVMVLPVKLPLPAEPVQITPAKNTSAQTEQMTPAEAQQEPTQPAALAEIAQRPALRIPDIPNGIIRISGFLWLTAAALLLGYRMAKYIMFLRTIKKHSVPECSLENIPKRLALRKTELLDAPLIVGLIKPVLYLPQAEIKEEELDYILLHELTHYRRHDLLYKWFAMLVSSIHWFNPFVYIVSRQIDEECEVSCDYEVCKTLTEPQKKDYMTIILDFVQTSIPKKRPLTTQMASSKKILKRRFLMMKTKKTTGKFVSVLSVVLALAMLSTTVFANGVLSGMTEDNYTIEITNNGEVIELVNKPFIENGEEYVPLREIFEKLNVINDIKWDNGKIDIRLALPIGLYQNNEIIDTSKVEFFYEIEIDNANIIVNPNSDINYSLDMVYVPILKNNTTYIPFPYLDYMLSQLDDEGYKVICNTWDKRNGSNINREADYTSVQGSIFNRDVYELNEIYNDARDITYSFFGAFSQREFDVMKNYCTRNCVNRFFGDGYVFGMREASLVNIEIDPMEYVKSLNDFNVLVTVNMTPHENSVFDPSQTSTSFYVILQRQSDGRYLIDEFATGL